MRMPYLEGADSVSYVSQDGARHDIPSRSLLLETIFERDGTKKLSSVT